LQTFVLPPAIAELVTARNKVRDHYQAMLEAKGGTAKLHFTLDGNLVGDIGEALAADIFGIRLVDTKSTEGIDGYAPDGRTVQVKATGTCRGPAFRQTQTRADHLLFSIWIWRRKPAPWCSTGQSISPLGNYQLILMANDHSPQGKSALLIATCWMQIGCQCMGKAHDPATTPSQFTK
jgi:hypothetical protein